VSTSSQSRRTWTIWNLVQYPAIIYYWTGLRILDHSYLVGNFINSKIAGTKAFESRKSWHFCISNFQTC
jgi:hypothetical protein